MLSETAAKSYERFCEFRDATVPELVAGGWTVDEEGLKVPNPIADHLPPVRLRYRSPDDGLYYGLKDAVSVATGRRPRREGLPKLTERQRDAILRYLYDSENASSIIEDCPEFSDDEGSFSGMRRAVEHFIEKMRKGVGR
jgi:hypothetical protein